MPQIMTTKECVRRTFKDGTYMAYLAPIISRVKEIIENKPIYVVNRDGKLIAIDDVVGD